MKMRFAAIAFSSVALLATPPASAASTDFYSGKTIEIIIGFAAGGGYDVAGRALSRHMGRYLPGNPNFVIRNMPGASSILMVNHLYNTAPQDGTALGMPNNALPIELILKILSPDGANVKFDVTKLQWIGSPAQEVFLTFVWANSPFRTPDDLRQSESLMGALSATGNSVAIPRIVNMLSGTKMRVIPGYKGQTEIFFAIEQGELHGTTTGLTNLSGTRGDWLRDGKVRVLIQYRATPYAKLPDVPLVIDLMKNDDDRALMNFLISTHRIARPIAAGPGVPAERITLLRNAFNATMKDAAFLDEAQKSGLDVDPIDGPEVADIIAKLSATPQTVVERTRQMLQSMRQ